MNQVEQLRIQAMYSAQAAGDPIKAEPTIPTSPDDIDQMSKGEVREYLEAHGVAEMPNKVGEMRDMLKQVMFTDL